MTKYERAVIGDLNWSGCYTCKNYRPNIGGCPLLDDDMAVIEVDIDTDEVYCDSYEYGPK